MARDPLLHLAQQAGIVGGNAFGIARQPAVGALFHWPARRRISGSAPRNAMGKRRASSWRGVTNDGSSSRSSRTASSSLPADAPRTCGSIQADRPDSEAGFIGLDGVLEIEKVITRHLLMALGQAVNSVLKHQFPVQHDARVDRADEPRMAQSRADHARARRQQAAEPFQPIALVIGARARRRSAAKASRSSPTTPPIPATAWRAVRARRNLLRPPPARPRLIRRSLAQSMICAIGYTSK